MTIKDVAVPYRFSVLLLGMLFLTNRYLSLPADARWVEVVAGDSYMYLAMAKAFPALGPDVVLPLHVSQRVFFPYVLGGVARVVGVPVEGVFSVFSVLAVLGIVFLFHRIMECLELGADKAMMLLSLLILNTYMFRYHVAIPWMISDLAFQLGLAALLLGLLRESPALTCAGLLASVLAKQTALALIPGVMAWTWWEGRARPARVKVAQCVGVALVVVGTYQSITWLVRRFSDPSLLASHVLGLVTWASSRTFSPGELSLFVLRGVIGFAFPAALFFSLVVARRLPFRWYQRRRFWLCLFLAGSIFLQPLLGGPNVTGQSITRLTMLGYLPLLVGLGSLLAETSLSASVQRRLVFMTALVAAMSSFHHFYSFLGVLDAGRAVRFAAVYLTSASVLFVGSLVLQRADDSG